MTVTTPAAEFDAMADASGNYAFMCAMERLRAIITGARLATEHDEFSLVDAVALMRLPTMTVPA